MDLDDPKLVTAHNHDPSSDTKVAAVKCRSEMKQQAKQSFDKQSFDKPSQIMTQAMSQIDVVVSLLASVLNVYTQLQSRLHQLCVDRRDWNKTVEEFLREAGHNIRWKPHGNQNQVVE